MEFIFQIGAVLLLVLLNGYFVASEFSLVAVRKTRIDELVKKGNITAKILQKAIADLDSYISATQLGITLASLALGWIGEPALARFIEPMLTFLPHEAALVTAHTLSVIIAFSIITFLHIVLGELTPKSIALQRSEATALVIITPLVIFSKIFRPFIWLLNSAGQIVLKIFGFTLPVGHQLAHSEEEVRMILRQSSESGVIPMKEVEMVYNVFQLSDVPVKLAMIPRTNILAFNVTTPLKEVVAKVEHDPHSRFPVFEGTIDSVIGFIHIKDVYREFIKQGGDIRLTKVDIIRKVIIVPEVKKIGAVLQEMRRKRTHLAVVSDEYGGTAGILTLEDIIESVIGDIEDEFDEPKDKIIKQRDGSYLIEGYTLIEDVRKKFHLPLKGQGYTTMGGLIFGLLGREARIGDNVQISNIELRVEQIDGKKIEIIRLRKMSA